MNYKTKKRIAAFLGLALYASVVAGCNSGELPSAGPTPADGKAPPPAAAQGVGEKKVRGKSAGAAAAN